MDPNVVITILSSVIAVGVGFVAVRWLFQKDTEQEERRRAAFHLAATLKGLGLTKIPEFLGDYAVGDYSGMAKRIYDFAKMVTDGGEEAVLKEFSRVFDNVLSSKLGSEEGRALIQSRLQDASSRAKDVEAAEAAKAGSVA